MKIKIELDCEPQVLEKLLELVKQSDRRTATLLREIQASNEHLSTKLNEMWDFVKQDKNR